MKPPPRPEEGLPPYGLLSDSIIGDVVGKQGRQVCKEREALGYAPIMSRHRDRQWIALRDAWGVEASERFLARSSKALTEFRATVAPKVPKTAPRKGVRAIRKGGGGEAWDRPIDVETYVAKHGRRGRGGAQETVAEFLARGGAVTRVPAGVVSERTKAELAKLRDGFPRQQAGP